MAFLDNPNTGMLAPIAFLSQQQKPPTAQETVNQAVTDAARQKVQQAEQTKQAQSINNAIQRGAMLQQGLLPTQQDMSQRVLDSIIMRYQQGLLGYKDAYNQAAASNDTEGMRDAQEGANVLRTQAAKEGLDLDSAYAGENNTRAELAAALNANRIRGYENVVGGLSSGDVYNQQFEYAMKNGANRKQADRYAADKAAAYQIKRLADLKTALYDYGLTDRNAINQFGANILQAMRDENPDSVALPNAYFAKPINDYTYMRGEDARNAQLARTKDTAVLNEALKAKLMNLDTSNKESLLQAQGAIQQALAAMNNSSRERIAAGTNATQMKIAAMGGNPSKGRNGSKSSGSNEPKNSDLIATIKLANEWDEKNPEEKSANPYRDAGDKATEKLNGQSPVPEDIDDYNSVYRWAQSVMEENYRRGYPMTKEQLAQAISSVGGYGPQVAQEMEREIGEYGR